MWASDRGHSCIESELIYALAAILDKHYATSPTKSPRPSLADVLIHNFLASTLIVPYTNSNDTASKQELAWSTNSCESTAEENPTVMSTTAKILP